MRSRIWTQLSSATCGAAVMMFVMAVPLPALAQVQPVNPQAVREVGEAAAITLSDSELAIDQQARPLAVGRSGRRPQSRNEIYNRGRAAEGRLGVRLGNDVGFRVSDQ